MTSKVLNGISFILFYVVITFQGTGNYSVTQDQTSSRPNTLSDDADDIQRQLDNEARDRIKYGRPKIIWVFKIPNNPQLNMQGNPRTEYFNSLSLYRRRSLEAGEQHDGNYWDYKTQEDWRKVCPDCGRRSQSPIDIYPSGLIRAHGARPLLMTNFDKSPKSWALTNDGRKVALYPEWESDPIPLITGGAVHARRYKFHSLHFHAPSEHTVGNLVFPLETQTLFLSAEYDSIKEATNNSRKDYQAILGIIDLYKYGNSTQPGLLALMHSLSATGSKCLTMTPALSAFCPVVTRYAFYQGSLTYPPCTETVAWFLRANTLSIVREDAMVLERLIAVKAPSFRSTQNINDRRIYLFN